MVLGQALLQMAAAVGLSHILDIAVRAFLSDHKGALENNHLRSLRYRGVEQRQAGAFAVPILHWPVYVEMLQQGGGHLIYLPNVRLPAARSNGALGVSLSCAGI